MLREGVNIMKQAWTTGSATLDGRYFQVDGAIVRPLPIQEGGIPLWIAGGGEKVTLKIAAKYANYTNFGAAHLDQFEHKSKVLRGHCDALSRDFNDITRSTEAVVVVGETEAEVDDRLKAISDRIMRHAPEAHDKFMGVYTRENPMVGTVEKVTENLAALEKAGMTYTIGYFPELAYDTTGVELFEQKVIPELS